MMGSAVGVGVGVGVDVAVGVGVEVLVGVGVGVAVIVMVGVGEKVAVMTIRMISGSDFLQALMITNSAIITAIFGMMVNLLMDIFICRGRLPVW